VVVALLVCLIPTTIGGLLSAIGIAGIDRMVQHNVLAMSGKAVEAAGDVDVLLYSSLGHVTPAAFAASLAEPPVAALPTAQQAKKELVLS
jgi:high-affinity K+ transport system ATPase subunit B